MKRLSIVIVSYNVRQLLHECLLSIEQSVGCEGVEVFVVDNASQDESIPFLRELHPEVTYIENHDNVGFARANNQALRLAQGEYVLLLNPDTLLRPDTLAQCLAFLDADPEAGACGVAQYDAQGRFGWECRRTLPTPWSSFCHMSGLSAAFPRSRLFSRYHMRFLPTDRPAQIEVMSGAFMMIRSSVLSQIGLLDERFFMYGEDIDLSYRITQAGWQIWWLPTPIVHYKGESTKKTSYRYVWTFYHAMLLFAQKHFRRRYWLFTLLLPLVVYGRIGLGVSVLWVKRNIFRQRT